MSSADNNAGYHGRDSSAGYSNRPDHGSLAVPNAGPESEAPRSGDHFRRGHPERSDMREPEGYARKNDRQPYNSASRNGTDNQGGQYNGDRDYEANGGSRYGRGGRGDDNYDRRPSNRGSFRGRGGYGGRGGSFYNRRRENSDRFNSRDGSFRNRRGSDFRGGDQWSNRDRQVIVAGLDINALLDQLEKDIGGQEQRDFVFNKLDETRRNNPDGFRSGKAITALISASARRRNVRLAHLVWDWLNANLEGNPNRSNSDMPPLEKNTYHYNSMIAVAASARRPGDALRLMKEMDELNIPKNEVTFSSAITSCEKSGDWRTAIDLLNRMEKEGLPRTAISYNAAISACEKGMVPQKACDLFQRMKREGIRPSVVTYSALISAAEKGGQWRLALEILEDMKRDGHRGNVIAYSAAISALAKGQQWELALNLFREVQSSGKQPSIVTYNATITALEKGLQWERALDLFDEMKRRNLPITVVSYGSALSACDKGLQYRQCLEFLDEMGDMNIEKNVIIFGAAMSCMEKCCRADICFQLMERMRFEGVAPNVHIYNSVISACARCNLWEKGYELFKEMDETGVRRDVVTYNAVLDAVCSQIQLGRELFQEGVKEGFYARVSRLGNHWFELDLHFLSLGGGEIALGWWFEECLVPYMKDAEKLKEVKSISIVTGYGKTRTRGRRQGDDGMRKRCKAMLSYMGIEEQEQPNLGRIHIDMESLFKQVEAHGRVIFDLEGYVGWKERNTTVNHVPDVPQKIRPRYKPEIPGSGQPPFVRIETETTSPEYRLGPGGEQPLHDGGGHESHGAWDEGRPTDARDHHGDYGRNSNTGFDRGDEQNRYDRSGEPNRYNDSYGPRDGGGYDQRGSFSRNRGGGRYESDFNSGRGGPNGHGQRGSYSHSGSYDRNYQGGSRGSYDRDDGNRHYGPSHGSDRNDRGYGDHRESDRYQHGSGGSGGHDHYSSSSGRPLDDYGPPRNHSSDVQNSNPDRSFEDQTPGSNQDGDSKWSSSVNDGAYGDSSGADDERKRRFSDFSGQQSRGYSLDENPSQRRRT